MNNQAKAGIGASVIGIMYTIMAYSMPRASIGNPLAPSIFPLILGVTLTVLGLALLIKEKSKYSPEKVKVKEVWSYHRKLTALTCAGGVAYALLFDRIGYILSTIIFLLIILFAINEKNKWKTNLIVAVCFSVAVYFIFSRLLGIPLPNVPFLD